MESVSPLPSRATLQRPRRSDTVGVFVIRSGSYWVLLKARTQFSPLVFPTPALMFVWLRSGHLGDVSYAQIAVIVPAQ